MTTTTTYGTWCNTIDSYSTSLEHSVVESLGDYGTDEHYDIEAIETEYREAINEALPAGVSLCGNEFYGPYYASDCDWTGYPVGVDDDLDLKAIVDGVDFWAIATKHERPA